jgi:hypothetical protein
MKIFNKLYLILLAFFCSFTSNYAQVSFVSESDGKITVTTTGIGKNKNEAVTNAEQNAFYIIFYRGVPGSSVKDKLIYKTEKDAENENKNYLEPFFDHRYQTFITSLTQNGKPQKEKHKQVSVSLDVTININALRKDLEENQLIRKFGY